MSAYLLIKATITDREKFSQYTQAVPGIIADYGGHYVVIERSPVFLEGIKDCESVVMSKWPTKEAAQAFWNSAAYRQVVPLREGTGEFQVMLLNGLEGKESS